jgi:hypothetical protein
MTYQDIINKCESGRLRLNLPRSTRFRKRKFTPPPQATPPPATVPVRNYTNREIYLWAVTRRAQ